MEWPSLPAEMYTLAGTLVGGLIGFLGTYFTQRTQAKLERQRIREARLGQVASDLAAVAHSTCWLTWSATRNYVDDKLINDYNSEIHQILPKIIGSHITLAASDNYLGQLTRKLVLDAHEVDEKIGEACILYETDRAKGIALLATINTDARKLDDDIFERLAQAARDGALRRFASRFRRGIVAPANTAQS